MFNKIFNFLKAHIYLFGLISNILPIIGLFVLEGVHFKGLHAYQFWAWIAGTIYYIFVWSVAIVAWKVIKKENKNIELKVAKLEKQINELEKQIKEKK